MSRNRTLFRPARERKQMNWNFKVISSSFFFSQRKIRESREHHTNSRGRGIEGLSCPKRQRKQILKVDIFHISLKRGQIILVSILKANVIE